MIIVRTPIGYAILFLALRHRLQYSYFYYFSPVVIYIGIYERLHASIDRLPQIHYQHPIHQQYTRSHTPLRLFYNVLMHLNASPIQFHPSSRHRSILSYLLYSLQLAILVLHLISMVCTSDGLTSDHRCLEHFHFWF
jgi:hypothetical protein